jgi:hypothetical protein
MTFPLRTRVTRHRTAFLETAKVGGFVPAIVDLDVSPSGEHVSLLKQIRYGRFSRNDRLC